MGDLKENLWEAVILVPQQKVLHKVTPVELPMAQRPEHRRASVGRWRRRLPLFTE
jgi:hypothetical protein